MKMHSNDHFEKDVDFTTHYSRLLLSVLGIWPMISRESGKMKNLISVPLRFVVFSLMLFVTVPGFIYVIFREKDATTRLVLVGPLIFCLASILKYLMIIYHRQSIAFCLEHMKADWMNIQCKEDWKIMKDNVKVGRDLTFTCLTFLYSLTTAFHLVLPLISSDTINEKNETIKSMIFFGYDIFTDVTLSPNYEIIICTCFLGSFLNSTVAIAACNIAASFVAHACGQFGVVISRLENLVEWTDQMKISHVALRERIKFVVNTHVRALGFSSEIEMILQEICFIEVVASTIMLCCDEYYCMMEWKKGNALSALIYVGILISLSFNMFIFCLIGELLKEQVQQCEHVVEAAYKNKWYNLPGKTGLIIVLIISTRNFPRKITAMRMLELSISSFGYIIKNTVAFLNVLRATGF